MIELEKIEARSAMKTDLAQLYPDATITEAIETFEEYRISGAPVVSTAGELLGVLSASDIVRGGRIHEGENSELEVSTSPFAEELEEGFFSFSREDYNSEILGRQRVADWMTPEVTTVGPADNLQRVCEIMSRDRIHRVFVVEDKKLVGVISTFDVVGHLAALSSKEQSR